MSPNINNISVILRQFLYEISGYFWWPENFQNLVNPDLEIIKHLQNPRPFFADHTL